MAGLIHRHVQYSAPKVWDCALPIQSMQFQLLSPHWSAESWCGLVSSATQPAHSNSGRMAITIWSSSERGEARAPCPLEDFLVAVAVHGCQRCLAQYSTGLAEDEAVLEAGGLDPDV
eukprot:EG_transcript_52552